MSWSRLYCSTGLNASPAAAPVSWLHLSCNHCGISVVVREDSCIFPLPMAHVFLQEHVALHEAEGLKNLLPPPSPRELDTRAAGFDCEFLPGFKRHGHGAFQVNRSQPLHLQNFEIRVLPERGHCRSVTEPVFAYRQPQVRVAVYAILIYVDLARPASGHEYGRDQEALGQGPGLLDRVHGYENGVGLHRGITLACFSALACFDRPVFSRRTRDIILSSCLAPASVEPSPSIETTSAGTTNSPSERSTS